MPARPVAAWFERRHAAGRAGRLEVATAYSQQELRERITSLSKSVDHLVVCVPCHLGAGALEALLRADLCLLPVGAETVLADDARDLLGRVRNAAPGRTIALRRVCVGGVPGADGPQSAQGDASVPLMRATLGADPAYAAAFEAGATAAEIAPGPARMEVIALMAEIRRFARTAARAAPHTAP